MADWTMRGLDPRDPRRIRSAAELTDRVRGIGFVPFFAGDIPGFSVEEHTASNAWWTGNRDTDPWEWREVVAAEHAIAYGKFFDGRAGFISPEWLPRFANARRNGWDFDGKWQNGDASHRERAIMEHFVDPESDDVPAFTGASILSTDLKRLSGFGKGGEKNYPGILTSLQMQLYLMIGGFKRRTNRRGGEFGMPVSVIMTPESIWGYDAVTAAYGESPAESWRQIYAHVQALFPEAGEPDIVRLIGRKTAD